jgi:hypothetical protein
MSWLIDRLKERSTWLAIFTFIGLLGMKVEPELRELIINAILGIAAVVAFVWREHRDPNERTRKTDVPEIELVGRSESTDAPRSPNVVSDNVRVDYDNDGGVICVRRSPVSSDATVQPEERGTGWNG